MLTDAEKAIPLRSLESEAETALRRMRSLVVDAVNDHSDLVVMTALAWVAASCAWWVGATIVEGQLLGLGAPGDVWGSVVALAKYNPAALQTTRGVRTTINAPAVAVLASAPLDGRLTTLGDLRDLCPVAGRAAEHCISVDGVHMDPRILRWICGRLGLWMGLDQPVVVRAMPTMHAASVRLVPWLMLAHPTDEWRVCIAAEHTAEYCP
jgi:hypothetical protein